MRSMAHKMIFAAALIFMTCMAVTAHAQNKYLSSPFVPWGQDQGQRRDQDQGFDLKKRVALKNTSKRAFKKRQRNRRAESTVEQQEARKPFNKNENANANANENNDSLRELDLPSRLEEAYSRRIVEELRQFGYDMFSESEKEGHRTNDDKKRTGLPAGAVQDDFVLNIDDKIDVVFRGQRKVSGTYKVNNQGFLIVEDLPPVAAAGRTILQVRETLEESARNLYNTDVFVSLDSVRQIDVLIVGHVKKPGRKTLTVFHTVLDALSEAGGIEKIGSLRQIKLVRHGRSTIIDLYGLLVHGSTNMDLGLQDGDKLIVPPIGPVVAVAGGVKRPGIYEILPYMKGMLSKPYKTSRKLSLEDMLTLAGGMLSPGQNRSIKLGLNEKGEETVENIKEPYEPVFSDGSILMVSPSLEARTGTVELVGETRRPGIHDLDLVPTLADLLDDKKVFGADIYPLIGVIERWNEDQMSAELIDFPPLLVVKGQFDRKLQDGDVVHLFSRTQILDLQEFPKDMPDIEPAGGSIVEIDEMINDPVLVAFLTERAAFIRGAVRRQGAYPVAEGTSLKNIIAVAGGLTLEANTRNVEVTSGLSGVDDQAHGRSGTRRTLVNFTEDDPGSVMLESGDSVRVNQKFHKIADNSVQIIGEVVNPGRYDLVPGDKLSDLLRRAGGLSAQAYPDGAIFSRNSERKAEESRFRAAARDLERALAVAMEDKDKAPDINQIAMARDLAAELRQVQAVGRITVEADPGMLLTQPELDILLESGDRIFIPRRPLTVRVSGEILSPASLQFRKDKDVRDYIKEAGSYTYYADKNRVFVLYPDGSAQPLLVNTWNHIATFIPPGSSIVVPRDPKPFDFIQSASDISQILSNLAITGIFVDNIRKN